MKIKLKNYNNHYIFIKELNPFVHYPSGAIEYIFQIGWKNKFYEMSGFNHFHLEIAVEQMKEQLMDVILKDLQKFNEFLAEFDIKIKEIK